MNHPVLQLNDVTEYMFADLCEDFAFYLYERANGGANWRLYDDFWNKFFKLGPVDWVEYEYITSLGTKVHMKREEGIYTFKVIQL